MRIGWRGCVPLTLSSSLEPRCIIRKNILGYKIRYAFPQFLFIVHPFSMKVSLAKQAQHHNYYPSEREGGKGQPDTREAPSKLLCIHAKSQRRCKTVLGFPLE